MTHSITTVVLTKDEEVNIQRCLESLSWCDEVLVVDSGSTDRTVEIARDMGACVVEHIMPEFDVTEQRNWALEKTGIKSEWVLFIDADEVVPPALREAILRRIVDAPPHVEGYQLCPKFMFMGRWLKRTCLFPSWHDRLVRRGRVRFVAGVVGGAWEQFESNENTERIEEPYLHHGLNKGFSAWLERHNRYSTYWAQEIWRRRKGPRVNRPRFFSPDPRERRRALHDLADNALFLRPILRFLYVAVWKCGFMDGFAGLLYALMTAFQQFMIYLKAKELERRERGLPL